MIAYAKRINVCRLDPRLPRQRFDRWFKEIVGPSAKIEWEVNDCGEQTGSPADKGRDFPFCAQAEATLPDGRKAVVRISVGTFKRGLSGEPKLFDAFIEREGQFYTIKQLGDLSERLSSKNH